jgi:hypothetical protein
MLVVQSFNPELPGIDQKSVHVFGWHFRRNHQIERLSLIDVILSHSRLVDNGRLVDLGESSEHFFLVVGQPIEMLDRSIVLFDAVPDVFGVFIQFNEQFSQNWILD